LDEMIAELRQVKQYARIPTVGDAPAASGESLGTDEIAIQTEIAAQVEAGTITAGDPAAGQEAFAARGCAGCHGQANGTGPALTGMWTRAVDDVDGRLTQTAHLDNPEAYIIQSIVNPGAYTVPGFNSGIMPANFSEVLSYQELANILAYIEEQD
jgi:mono/diheme cytochrome c family protein